MTATLTVDVSRFTERLRRIRPAVAPDSPALRDALHSAGRIYMGAMRRRFVNASHGDGTWPDLAASTKYERARVAAGGFKRQRGVSKADRMAAVASVPFPILYITGHSYSSLSPGAPDNIERDIPGGVAVGTTAKNLYYAQKKPGRAPYRRVLVMPDQETIREMQREILRGVQVAIK